jgi:hypothetical protein
VDLDLCVVPVVFVVIVFHGAGKQKYATGLGFFMWIEELDVVCKTEKLRCNQQLYQVENLPHERKRCGMRLI